MCNFLHHKKRKNSSPNLKVISHLTQVKSIKNGFSSLNHPIQNILGLHFLGICKTLLQIQSTYFDPTKIKVTEIRCICSNLYQMHFWNSFHCMNFNCLCLFVVFCFCFSKNFISLILNIHS